MKSTLTTLFSFAIVLCALSLPLAVGALCETTNAYSVCNPLGNMSLMQFVALALRAFVIISIPILAFFIVLAGFNFILARGNQDKLTLAKWNFTYVIVGTVLILGAWVFSNLIYASIQSISS